MADKGLLIVISEMLLKQDQHSELIKETNNTLKQFMEVSVKQFEQQYRFQEHQNEFDKQFLEQNHKIVDRLGSIEQKLVHIAA